MTAATQAESMPDSCSSSSKQLSYDALVTDPNRNQIRVLEILQDRQDTVPCNLKTVDLNDYTP
jgi:hypothetical protein